MKNSWIWARLGWSIVEMIIGVHVGTFLVYIVAREGISFRMTISVTCIVVYEMFVNKRLKYYYNKLFERKVG